jgi:hypothetical protein
MGRSCESVLGTVYSDAQARLALIFGLKSKVPSHKLIKLPLYFSALTMIWLGKLCKGFIKMECPVVSYDKTAE